MRRWLSGGLAVLFCLILSSQPAMADAVFGFHKLKEILMVSILPGFALLGFGYAAFGFFMGNPNAKTHLQWAIVGAFILFGAQSIIDIVKGAVK